MALVVALGGGVMGCAARRAEPAAPAAGSPSSDTPPESSPSSVTSGTEESDPDGDTATSLADAIAGVDAAEAQLAGLFGEPSPAEPGDTPTPDPAAPKTTPHASGLSTDGPRSRCTSACSALASMRRSATQLCSLTGDDDARCEGVQARVARAEVLVTRSCSSCG